MRKQGIGEGAMLAGAIRGGGSVLRGKGNEDVTLRLDICETAADRSRPACANHPRRERIVAAGIEYDQAELASCIHLGLDLGKGDRLVGYMRIALQSGIGRDKVVDAVHLHAMTGEVDHGPLRPLGQVAKLLERLPHLLARKIIALHHLRKAQATERHGRRLCIVFRVAENACVDVIGIADHERNPLRGDACRSPSLLRLREPRNARARDFLPLAVGFRKRRHFQDPAKIAKRALTVLLPFICAAAIGIGKCIFGIELDSLVIVRNGAVQLSLSSIGDTAVIVDIRKL